MNPTRTKPKYKFMLKYRIFKISPDGLLKCPELNEYGESYWNDSNSIEEAHKVVEKKQVCGEFLILPISLWEYAE